MKLKKIFIAFVVATLSGFVYADDYSHITFVTSDCLQSIESSNLVMTVSGNNLVATNGTTTLTLSLSQLQKMYFSDSEGVYTNLQLTEENQTITEVFTLDGRSIGTFQSLREAVIGLNKGSYILRQGQNTQKIILQ